MNGKYLIYDEGASNNTVSLVTELSLSRENLARSNPNLGLAHQDLSLNFEFYERKPSCFKQKRLF